MKIIKILRSLRRRIKTKYYKKYKSNNLVNRDITIISNNCWAGSFYNLHNNRFNTPTINLYFMAEDYLKFVKDYKKYLLIDLKFIEINDSKHYNFLSKQNYTHKFPIGVLDDIEIFFLHYKTEEEAKDSWEKRKLRVNHDNIIFKFNDQNECSNNHLIEFDNLKHKNKIIFTVRDNLKLKNAIYIDYKNKTNELDGIHEPFIKYKNYDIVKIINDAK